MSVSHLSKHGADRNLWSCNPIEENEQIDANTN